ncbi:RNA methyltransferase [Candidatus Gracilibacteria bacterium]|nr:RNA methyltransferase [Candidatus Gracilibacteria bacterium]
MDRSPFFALLDNVRSMHNVGAIFRTSDAVLLKKLYLCGITAAPPRKEISKTALGADELVPFEYFDDAVEAVKALKAEGVRVVAVELAKGAAVYSDFKWDGPVCYVFGHEVEGISDEVMEEVDDAVYVPMLGRANSLNVATCFGVVMLDALRKISGRKLGVYFLGFCWRCFCGF